MGIQKRFNKRTIRGGAIVRAPGEHRNRLLWFAFEEKGMDYFFMTSEPGDGAFVYSTVPGSTCLVWTRDQIRAKLEFGDWKLIRNIEYSERKCH